MSSWYCQDNSIHPSAVIHENATIGNGTEIGPYSIIGPDVKIGDRCIINSHVVIDGDTSIGNGCRIYNGASIGLAPQDLKYKGENSRVIIGCNNTIREYVTINKGTQGGGGLTSIGDNNLIMAYTHIAHDCSVGNNVIIANSSNLAGHVVIEDNAVLSGATGIVQHVRIGNMSMTGGMSKISKDIPPFFVADGNPCEIRGVNIVGMQRKGASEEAVNAVRNAYKLIYMSKLTIKKAVAIIEEKYGFINEISLLLKFIEKSEKGIVR